MGEVAFVLFFGASLLGSSDATSLFALRGGEKVRLLHTCSRYTAPLRSATSSRSLRRCHAAV